ncbi:MAG: 2-oxoacid:acceptor oxidoreductase subunit alpha, partial [Thermoplasmata archaeon]
LREKMVMPRLKDVKLVKRPEAESNKSVFGGQPVPAMMEFGCGGFIHVTGSTHKTDGMRDVESQKVHEELITRIYSKIETKRDDIVMVESKHLKSAKVAVVSYGASARPSLGAVEKARRNKKKVGFLRLITIWPFARKQIAELGKQVDTILVPEMNLGQISREIERFVDCDVVSVPKIGGIAHSIDEIYAKIKEVV